MIWGDPIYKLGIFLEIVLENMESTDQVRFGETGTGIRPRYAVYTENGNFKQSYHGKEFDTERPKGYLPENISAKYFSYQEVLEAKKIAELLNQ